MDRADRPSDRLRKALERLGADRRLSTQDLSDAIGALRSYMARAKAREFSEAPLKYSIISMGEDGESRKELAGANDLPLARAAFTEALATHRHVVLRDGSTDIAASASPRRKSASDARDQ